MVVPPNHTWINRVFHYKPSILGYPSFLETPISHPSRHFWVDVFLFQRWDMFLLPGRIAWESRMRKSHEKVTQWVNALCFFPCEILVDTFNYGASSDPTSEWLKISPATPYYSHNFPQESLGLYWETVWEADVGKGAPGEISKKATDDVFRPWTLKIKCNSWAMPWGCPDDFVDVSKNKGYPKMDGL